MAATATNDRSRFLDLRALSGLAHMRFATKRQIEGAYSGRHRSKQKGGAAEFVDYREYSAGEDLRRLDWKVLARTGRPFVRIYQDETNLLCTLLLDGRTAPTVEDIRAVALPVLRHRILPNHRAVGDAVTSDAIVERLLRDVK